MHLLNKKEIHLCLDPEALNVLHATLLCSVVATTTPETEKTSNLNQYDAYATKVSN